ncbi:OmpA family protein [Novosphingobium sp. BW1]|uniref:OmpA family protein n=1 Tax=Novosphingobium sp. BW1 TaxID=2592621 RepID=UPI0011DEDA88|nr:OmpA family protein [Novosphingobium sp. BW1]TYC85610.1 OmpA family protein [Novosphingobium sp. BW1]
MRVISNKPAIALALGALAAGGTATAQDQGSGDAELTATMYSDAPADTAEMVEGPELEGFISARDGNRLQITGEDGARNVVTLDQTTQIVSKSGIFGISSKDRTDQALLNGLPVDVRTMQNPSGDLVASRIKFQKDDFETAAMIRNGTEQGFAEQTAATEALRGRMGDIDKYNIKGTTNVNFATGKWNLSSEAKADLCATASAAEGMDNALMLVVGYTDSTGSQEFNQMLSEKRAAGVVNYLQQACGWKPYRMLTPTGMAEADPLADNTTEYGKAQNRRVAVNILVSKGLDGL